MDDGSNDTQTGELTPRTPSLEDVVDLCRKLNSLGTKYEVNGVSIPFA